MERLINYGGGGPEDGYNASQKVKSLAKGGGGIISCSICRETGTILGHGHNITRDKEDTIQKKALVILVISTLLVWYCYITMVLETRASENETHLNAMYSNDLVSQRLYD
jgi:hypothetical protein